MSAMARLNARIDADLDDALRRAVADHEDRSLTWLVKRILREWLIEHGYMPKPGRRGKA